MAEKSPGVALLLSFFIPGLGSIYIGQVGFGIGLMFMTFIFGMMSFYLVPLMALVFICWIYGMSSAYSEAKKMNSAAKEPSKPAAPQEEATEPRAKGSANEALEILKLRYAKGEIKKTQYLRMKAELED